MSSITQKGIPRAFEVGLLALLAAGPALSAPREPIYPKPPSIEVARRAQRLKPEASPETIARQTLVGEKETKIIQWMQEGLREYLANFDPIFEAKLQRIHRHQVQRQSDFEKRLASVDPHDAEKIKKLTEIHKPHGFVAEYRDSADFIEKFVGPKGKVLKGMPLAIDRERMDRPGKKQLFVDTWGVPFFNTGTQSRDQARKGVRRSLAELEAVNLETSISVMRFTELMAIYARPEFDDVRRYKLLPFPPAEAVSRFGAERSDAKVFGDRYPAEAPSVENEPVGIEPISFMFGQRDHLFGMIKHAIEDITADGRIFTGPADFLEHDYAHAFFNSGPGIPGTAEDWVRIHREFIGLLEREGDPRSREMMKLVYYHFTHESGYRILLPDPEGRVKLESFREEIHVIDELLHTRFHYDFMLADNAYPDGYEPYLASAFSKVGVFFRKRFLELQGSGDSMKIRRANGVCTSQAFLTVLRLKAGL